MIKKELRYDAVGTDFAAYYVAPDAPGPHPVVLVCPTWAGLEDNLRASAEKVAAEGYCAMAINVNPDDLVLETVDDKRAVLEKHLSDRNRLLQISQAAFNFARSQPEADASRAASIGFCFGGLMSLDMARVNTEGLRAISSFHGVFVQPDFDTVDNMKAKVLLLNGDADPMVLPENVEQVRVEMNNANASWQLHNFGGVKHAYTNPKETNPDSFAVYDKVATDVSWLLTFDLLARVLRS